MQHFNHFDDREDIHQIKGDRIIKVWHTILAVLERVWWTIDATMEAIDSIPDILCIHLFCLFYFEKNKNVKILIVVV